MKPRMATAIRIATVTKSAPTPGACTRTRWENSSADCGSPSPGDVRPELAGALATSPFDTNQCENHNAAPASVSGMSPSSVRVLRHPWVACAALVQANPKLRMWHTPAKATRGASANPGCPGQAVYRRFATQYPFPALLMPPTTAPALLQQRKALPATERRARRHGRPASRHLLHGRFRPKYRCTACAIAEKLLDRDLYSSKTLHFRLNGESPILPPYQRLPYYASRRRDCFIQALLQPHDRSHRLFQKLHRLTPQRLLECTSLFSREIANKVILQTGNPTSLQAITVVSPFAVKPLAHQYAKYCPSGPSSAVPERTFRRKSAARRRSSGSR